MKNSDLFISRSLMLGSCSAPEKMFLFTSTYPYSHYDITDETQMKQYFTVTFQIAPDKLQVTSIIFTVLTMK